MSVPNSMAARQADKVDVAVPVEFSVKAVRICLALVFISATVLQRFGISLGTYSLNSTILAIYLLIALSLFYSNVQVALDRLLMFAVCVCLIAISLGVNANLDGFSLSTTSSMALVVLMYLPFIFVLKPRVSQLVDPQWAFRCLSNVLLFCAFAGILQFYTQFVFRPDWLFDFTDYIPAAIRGPSGFNTVIPVGSLYKSNGFFFREPSGASFAMAFGILMEIHLFRRVSRLAIFGLALAVTYSGTGVLGLLVGLAFPLSSKTLWRAVALALVGLVSIWLLNDPLNLSYTLGRVDEFGSERSSGYIRYVAPLRLASEQLFLQPWSFWLGNGAGTITRLSQSAFEFHDPTWAKLLVEYGVLGFVSFLGLVLACLIQRHLPASLCAVLFVSWLVMGGHLLSPENVHFAYALSGLFGCWYGYTRLQDRSTSPELSQRWSFI